MTFSYLMFYFLIILVIIMMILLFVSLLRPKKEKDFWDRRAQKLMHKRPYSIYNIISYSFIIIAGIYLLIIPLIKKFQVPSPKYGTIISALSLIILLDLCLLYSILKQVKVLLLYKKATTEGEKVEGTIINYCYFRSTKAPNEYHVVVKYNDINTDEEKTMLSPHLSFDPSMTLGTNKCDVCLYKNAVIISGFKSHLDTNTIRTVLPLDNSYLHQYTTLQKAIAILALIITIVFAFFAIAGK